METLAGFDAAHLARIQFGFTIAFHIIFPAFSIGLSAFIATLELRWLYSRQPHLHTLARFWTKIFAVSFAMGVVSGIVMEYQIGTNWSGIVTHPNRGTMPCATKKSDRKSPISCWS